MKNKIFLIVSLACIVVGAVIGYFAQMEVAKLTAFAVTMFGAGLAVAKLWNNKKEGANKVLVILSMVFVGLGAFLAGLTGSITETQITTIIGYVFSLILIVAGIITSVVANKKVGTDTVAK